MVQADAQIEGKRKVIHRQVRRFLVSGGSAVATDTIVYFLLLNIFNPSLAKGASFLSGTFVAFLLNKFWTFESSSYSRAEMTRFVFLYLSTLGINMLINTAMLHFFTLNKVIPFLLATGASTVLNFIGQKWWVFKA